MASRSVRFGVRSRKLSNVGSHRMGDQKFVISSSVLVGPAFVVVSSHQSALGPHGGLWPVLLNLVIHKEGLCPSSGDISGMMMIIKYVVKVA
jgi:hypothetical protein